MTATIDSGVDFTPVELDLLATHAGARLPFPLRTQVFGAVARERDALLAEAAHGLRARGLATGDGPVGVAQELVTALREHRASVDLVVIGGVVTGAVAVVHQDRAVVCRQTSGAGWGSAVRVVAVPADDLAGELTALVPDVRAAVTMPITLPPGAVDGALDLTGDEPDTRRQARELVRACGGDPGAVDRLVELFPAVTGRGQLGVVRRSGAAVTRLREVSWLDSARGRVRVDRGDGGWVSVNPLRHGDLVRLIGEVAEVARA
ncbi:ESX secretion-associated protein EspG [Saccharothrix sp. HUAS TT1]|uniref:ESX secretion-associated protein EspG n=1 Tax=unclassified Saccharothrix TaxID=2593673 RepID=UPI00345B6488